MILVIMFLLTGVVNKVNYFIWMSKKFQKNIYAKLDVLQELFTD